MERIFEKISLNQFKKDVANDEKLYQEYLVPKRATRTSAGYDFFAIENFILKPGEILRLPTGIKSKFKEDETLLILIRSSMGFKYNIRLCNQVGVIDSDYYNNDSNEGHIFIALQNEGDKEYIVKKGQAFAQGIFTKFLITDDDNAEGNRIGGIGSTN